MTPSRPTLALLGVASAASACNDNKVSVYNTPPGVAIHAPLEGDQYNPGELVEFIGVATDSQDPSEDLDVQWSSSIDGQLGVEPPDANGDVYLAVSALSSGTHSITLKATDTSAESATTSITVQVGYGDDSEGAPTVILTGPADGSEYSEGQTVTFVGTVTDAEQSWDTVWAALVSSCDGMLWSGYPDSSGIVSVDVDGLSVCSHSVDLVAEDDEGHVAQDTAVFAVLDDGRPTVEITSPATGTSWWTTDTLTFQGIVDDTETDIELLEVFWTSSLDGLLYEGNPDSDGDTAHSTTLSEGTHEVELVAVDGDGQEGSDVITIEVIDPLNHDDDGDGQTENEGDCDDGDADVYSGAAEICDNLDNDCDGDINEDDWDGYEDNESSTDAYDLGEVDGSILWEASSLSVSGLTHHEEYDEDWFIWDADDEFYDNVDITVSAGNFDSSGTYVLELYLKDGSTWDLKDSDSGSGKLIVSYEGSIIDFDEDDWAVRVYASTWPSNSCDWTYTIDIDS